MKPVCQVHIRYESITGQFLVVPYTAENKKIMHLVSYHDSRDSAERAAAVLKRPPLGGCQCRSCQANKR